MSALHFTVPGATIATSSTAKTVLGVKAPANHRVIIHGFFAGFDGTDSTKGPALVEICTCTFATNDPGTNSTAVTEAKTEPSVSETVQSQGGKTWTTEPTVITPVDNFMIPTYMGSGVVFYPLKTPLIVKGGEGAVMRVTLPATVTANFSGSLKCEE